MIDLQAINNFSNAVKEAGVSFEAFGRACGKTVKQMNELAIKEEVIEVRWYQEEAVGALVNFIDDFDGHPLVVVPTGAGKTFIICEFVDQYLSDYPSENVLVLSHVKEVLEQDHAALEKYFGEETIGMYSASVGIKNRRKITVAGIQSIYRNPIMWIDYGIIIIDECHLINHADKGMYRSFLRKIEATYIGLTATPYRLGHGYIHKGDDALFTEIVYDLSSFENFNRLVDEGYLCKLITKDTDMEMDLSNIGTTAGDYNQKQLGTKFDRNEITENAVEEIIKYGKNYKKWLIFAIDIEHAEHIAEKLRAEGIATGIIHSKMKGSRDDVVNAYRSGELRALVNVDMATTGLDVPDIDLIAMLRPTKSPVLHVQSIGRGLRVFEGKDHCLVLDFAGNTERLGPINDVKVRKKGKGLKGGEPITKLCPNCDCRTHPSTKICEACGHIYEFKSDLRTSASTHDVVRTQKNIKGWHKVKDIDYRINNRKGSPSSLLVSYKCGLKLFKEWVCIDHKGYARAKAKAWIQYRYEGVQPETVDDLYQIRGLLSRPTEIYVDESGKYPEILNSKFDNEENSLFFDDCPF